MRSNIKQERWYSKEKNFPRDCRRASKTYGCPSGQIQFEVFICQEFYINWTK